jgi:BlaI family penicillinase repressor
MTKSINPKPTDRELTILRILWDRGPSTVRDVNETMNAMEPTGYTTTLKLMQIMVQKGLVVRDESRWRHVYKAASTEKKTQTQLVRGLLDKAFAGSTEKLVLRALTAKKVPAEELARIKEIIDQLEGS